VHQSIGVALIASVIAACAAEHGSSDSARRALAADSASAAAAAAVDDFGNPIVAPDTARRIVSLNPATTELLFALGAGERLVGRTHWDEWPEAARAVPDLGPGLRPNVEAVLAARPDLVVLYASAENRPAAERLRAAGVSTLSLKIDRIEHFDRAARLLGHLLGDSVRGRLVADTVRATLDSVRASTANRPRVRVAWPVDVSPLIVIGGGSFLTQLIEIAGAVNVYGDVAAVSPQLSLEDLHRRNPEIVIANPRLAARIRGEPAWRVLEAVRAGRIVEADEVLMGRQSVRMGEAAVALARLLHPELAAGR
jgi:ABC-type Fe3+-hydroxamate transport system substrate-binding protein